MLEELVRIHAGFASAAFPNAASRPESAPAEELDDTESINLMPTSASASGRESLHLHRDIMLLVAATAYKLVRNARSSTFPFRREFTCLQIVFPHCTGHWRLASVPAAPLQAAGRLVRFVGVATRAAPAHSVHRGVVGPALARCGSAGGQRATSRTLDAARTARAQHSAAASS